MRFGVDVRVDAEGGSGGEGHDFVGGFKLFELGVGFDADQAFGIITLILADEGFERAAEGRNKMDARDGLDGGVGGRGLGGDGCDGRANGQTSNGDSAVAGHRSGIGKDGVGGGSSYLTAA